MPSSGYTAITFVADELLTSTKMNQMAANDAAFNNGNGFEDSIILNRHIAAANLHAGKIYNPYKFAVYRNAAHSNTAGVYTKVPFDTEEYDTNSNFDSTTNRRYVAPVNGFYSFKAVVGSPITGAGTDNLAVIYKNGVIFKWGVEVSTSMGLPLAVDMQLSAGDYVEIYSLTTNGVGINVGPLKTYFMGFLISAT